MINLTFTLGSFEIYNISRIPLAIAFYLNSFEVAVTPGKLVFSKTFVVRFAISHLRIICGLIFIKDTNILMFSKRLFFSVKKVCRFGFSPGDFLLNKFGLEKMEVAGKNPWPVKTKTPLSLI